MSKNTASTVCRVKDLGLVAYRQAYQEQMACVQSVLHGGDQTVLLCEHHPVLTLGRLAKPSNLLMPEEMIRERGVDIHNIDRGGDVTLHAPGQLVVYPILDLNDHGRDLRIYLRKLEQVIIDFLEDVGVRASRIEGRTGAWVNERKIASIGIGVKKWVSYHGMAINISTDLSLYSMIRPCDLDVTMTSVAEIRPRELEMIEAKERIMAHLVRIFNLEIKE